MDLLILKLVSNFYNNTNILTLPGSVFLCKDTNE